MTNLNSDWQTVLAGLADELPFAIEGALDDAYHDRAAGIEHATVAALAAVSAERHHAAAASWSWEILRGNIDALPSTIDAAVTVGTLITRALVADDARRAIVARA